MFDLSKKSIALFSAIIIIIACFSACKGKSFTLGTYSPADTEKLSAVAEYDVTDEEFNFEFKDDGKFSAYLSFGHSIAGDYEVKGGKIHCNVISAKGEYVIDQATSAKIVFKIADEKTLEIEEISKSYPVLVEELIDGLWYTSDESKEMPLSPLEKGVVLTRKGK